MPEDFEYDDDTDEPDDSVKLSKAQYDDLNAKARQAKKASAEAEEAAAAKRELAFVKAGVDTDSPLGKLLLKGYSGELTAEAIKAEAISVGAIAAPESTDPVITPEEAASTTERSDLANGADVTLDQDPDPTNAAIQAARAHIDAGATEADGMAIGMRELAKDQRNWHQESSFA
jgi:hypothetical protein